MTIYITRHGQSLTNIDADVKARARGEKISIDTKNNILTEIGIQQALDFGHWVKDKNIEVIVTSPYARAKQTAFCIASVLANCAPVHYDRGFREIEWEINGKFQRIEERIPDFDTKNCDIDLRPSVRKIDRKPLVDHKRGAHTTESQRDVYNRAIPAFLKRAERHKGKNLLIVSHFFVVRSILSFIHAGTSDAMLDYTPRNLERAVIEPQDIDVALAGGPFRPYVAPELPANIWGSGAV